MKKIVGVLILLLLLCFPKSVFADEDFSTFYDVTYEVGADGVTSVTEKITLTNLTSRYYVSNFTLTIGSTTVSDVLASDEAGVMETKVDISSNKTAITVKFNQQVAGIGKKQTFALKFKSKDFAQNLGRTWEVNLPKIPTAGIIEGYNLTLSVPAGFGEPTSIIPRPKSESQTYNKLSFHFSRDQLKNGVSVNFGTFQIFDFKLKYNLENNSLFPIIASITLPPDTNYQDVLIGEIIPQPINVTVDEDGNFLAWYKLVRGAKEEITVSGSAKLYISVKEGYVYSLPAKDRHELTKSDQYWEKDNPLIISTLKTIFKNGIPSTSSEKARLIYRYTVDHLIYDVSRINNEKIERFGAVTILNNPNLAVCMEFTDLFIALSRAAGVPAREINGFAYTQNPKLRPLSLRGDLLHAWPQYFDEERGWVMVDPTWENTSGGVDYFNKFDLNHLVLTIKGYSSQSPQTTKDVQVTISKDDFIGKAKTEAIVDLPENIWAGFPAAFSVTVTNSGNMTQKPTVLTINSGEVSILGEKTVQIPSLPPLGSKTYTFNLRTPFGWQSFDDVIEVRLSDEKFTKTVVVKPVFMFIPFPYFFGGFFIAILLIYGLTLIIHLKKGRMSLKEGYRI